MSELDLKLAEYQTAKLAMEEAKYQLDNSKLMQDGIKQKLIKEQEDKVKQAIDDLMANNTPAAVLATIAEASTAKIAEIQSQVFPEVVTYEDEMNKQRGIMAFIREAIIALDPAADPEVEINN